jgi:acyl-coenzyme A thioesterase PaaI-like protein
LSDSSDSPVPKPNFWQVPEVAPGAWGEKRKLAAALRKAIAACIAVDASETALREATLAAQGLVDALAPFPRSSFQAAHKVAVEPADVHEFADRGVLIGQCNPLAPPMRFSFDTASRTSIGEVTFGVPYEGAPGWVHGGIIAAAFDQLFGHLQVNLNVPSFTANLTVNYRSPTPIGVALRLEGQLSKQEGRKSFVSGRCIAGAGGSEYVCAEATAVFVAVDREKMHDLFHNQPSTASSQES